MNSVKLFTKFPRLHYWARAEVLNVLLNVEIFCPTLMCLSVCVVDYHADGSGWGQVTCPSWTNHAAHRNVHSRHATSHQGVITLLHILQQFLIVVDSQFLLLLLRFCGIEIRATTTMASFKLCKRLNGCRTRALVFTESYKCLELSASVTDFRTLLSFIPSFDQSGISALFLHVWCTFFKLSFVSY